MTPLLGVGLALLGGFLGGVIGALTGLGGGIIVVPLLTLVLHLPITEAVGVSLFGVMAISVGAAPRFVGTGLSNVRVALFLQMAASAGALVGALVSHDIPARALFLMFGLVMLYNAIVSFLPSRKTQSAAISSPLAQRLKLAGRYQERGEWQAYEVASPLPAFGIMLGAGMLSALLGIGSGVFKVMAMDKLMRLPFKVSTATSNFMIGITAATSAGYYLSHGDVPPLIAAPVVLGTLGGAYLGGHWMKVLPVQQLRRIFAVVLMAVALQMLYQGIRP
ncbi:MAG TPA: sulfite exporter TauE/SafE family protein [Gammaproteobacteria bacterium]|nr:sulfite exporter TauE/SafE family protein [Gammaproteobacteria bacterium]